ILNKVPGLDHKHNLQTTKLDLSYSETFNQTHLADAYERLLLETDAPYLLPRDLQPKPASRRNEPCFLPHIVHQVAVWRQEEPQWLGQKTDENARRL
ncbi:TatD family hydrolase, partial [Klebsiella michiganensis]